nr:peptide chain release factor 2 [Candidatus Oleimmundimicrobium sp.]
MFDIDVKRKEIGKLELKMNKPGFWDEHSEAQKIMEKLRELKDDVLLWDEVHKEYDNVCLLNELAVLEKDKDLYQETKKNLKKLKNDVEQMELRSWFTEKFDQHDCIVSIHPGAGGIESQDWAEILLRMYLRWAERRDFKSEINDIQADEEAGIKSVTFTVKGKNAYGFLRVEKGVHRLVRISPFDASSRRHTSFSSVDVIPVIEEDIEIIIDPKDLRIETYRASGAGGQHVNVTDSAVRITHIPTGTVAQCQNERSQFQNKDTAMKILRSRLFEKERERKREELTKIRGEKKEIAWGSQIRSYILHPYSLAKDHRTGVEKGNIQAVLDGDLDDFIIGCHRQRVAEKKG